MRKLALFGLLLIAGMFSPAPAQATITLGVTTRCVTIASADPFTCAVSGTYTVGSLVDIWIQIVNDRTIASVSDGTHTYSVCSAKQGTTAATWHYCAITTSALVNPTITVDITGGNSGGSDVSVTEWISTNTWNATVTNNAETAITRVTGTNETTIVTGTFSTTAASTVVLCATTNSSSRTMTATQPSGLSPTLVYASGASRVHSVYAILTSAASSITCGGTLSSAGTGTWQMSGMVYKDTAVATTKKRPIWY